MSRFEEYVARKTREAVDAVLPPYVTERDGHDRGAIGIGNSWSRSLFDGSFYLSPSVSRDLPACSLVFVQSREGNTGSRNPTELGGGETDKHLIYEGLSRVAADAVLSGAETIRGGHLILSVWHPELVRLRAALGKPRHPVQIIATLQGLNVDNALMFNVPELNIVLLMVDACTALMRESLAARPWITPVVMDRPQDLAHAFRLLRARGIERICCIGGRKVATQLIDAGLVQDVYLTTSPHEGGEPNTPLYPKPLDGNVVVRKKGTGPETGVTFEHIVLSSQQVVAD